MEQFSVAKIKNGKWIWKLINYTHVYHRSPEFKTKKSCERNLECFVTLFDMAKERPTYYCKEVQ